MRLLLVAMIFAPWSSQAAVTPQLQQAIRESTFEVVMKKPEKEAVTYEKPLPLELMPYIERTDAYRSMGTAFALGHNTYVTAGHVIIAGINSQFGPPVLRRSDGTIFEIDRILKFSAHEDFVVFSLKVDPNPKGLEVNRTPSIDQQVLAVGNALGEGIVIRDGLFTSETPEQQDGRWKWIRFSAAASPGNSGGPLCDADGKVIGIVIGKSENENLNYSLPIVRAMDGSTSEATLDQRQLAGMPLLHGTTTYALKDKFSLPQAWGGFVQAYMKVVDHHFDVAEALVLSTNASTLFPKGDGSLDVLYRVNPALAPPRLINQGADGMWAASQPEYRTTDLTQDGSVRVGDMLGIRLVRLIRPAHASDDAFYSDSKGFMDLALKGLDLRRPVGQDKVRVTSLGAAVSSSLYTDDYGRKWQERTWAVPFFDTYIVAQLLPTPDGYDAIMLYTPSNALHATLQTSRWLAQHIDLGYSGTLAQWQAMLKRKDLLPRVLEGVALTHRDGWTLDTARVSSTVTPDILSLTDRSLLSLDMAYSDERPKVEWLVKEIRWDLDDRRAVGASVWRSKRPPSDAKLELRNLFDSIAGKRSPYDGSLSRESAEVYSMTHVLTVPGKTPGTQSGDVKYAVTVTFDNYQSAGQMGPRFVALEKGTKVLEHGETSEPLTASIPASIAAPVQDKTSDQQAAQAWAQHLQKAFGKDIRGREISDDVRDYTQSLEKQLGGREPSDAQKKDLQRHIDWMESYWSEYPALGRNHDMWAEFLRKNHLPEITKHSDRVIELQTSLYVTLSAGYPSEHSGESARELKKALIDERNTLVRKLSVAPDSPLSARTTPCGPAVTKVSTSRQPAFFDSDHSLEELWPLASKSQGEEGTVLVRINISPEGCAQKFAIVGFSGSETLDATVMRFVEGTSFKPGCDEGGKAIETTVTMPVVFKLKQ